MCSFDYCIIVGFVMWLLLCVWLRVLYVLYVSVCGVVLCVMYGRLGVIVVFYMLYGGVFVFVDCLSYVLLLDIVVALCCCCVYCVCVLLLCV